MAAGLSIGLAAQEASAKTGAVDGVYDETALSLTQPVATAESPALPSSLGAIIRTLIALVVTAILIYFAVVWLKRIARPKIPNDPHLKVLASAHLGANRFVHVIAFGEQAWIIGAADAGVNLIAEIADKEAKDLLFLDESRGRSDTSGAKTLNFQSLFSRFYPGGRNDRGPIGITGIFKRPRTPTGGAGEGIGAESGNENGGEVDDAGENSDASLNAVRKRRERLRNL